MGIFSSPQAKAVQLTMGPVRKAFQVLLMPEQIETATRALDAILQLEATLVSRGYSSGWSLANQLKVFLDNGVTKGNPEDHVGPFLPDRDRRKGGARNVFEHVTALAEKAARDVEKSGTDIVDSLWALKDVLDALNEPFTTHQGEHGTCAAEAIQTMLRSWNVSEWTRVLATTLLEGQCLLADGKTSLILPSDLVISGKYSPKARCAAAKIFQGGILRTFPMKQGGVYNDSTDKYHYTSGTTTTTTTENGGMTFESERAAMRALFGCTINGDKKMGVFPPQLLRRTEQGTMRPREGVLLNIEWGSGSGSGSGSSLHAVIGLEIVAPSLARGASEELRYRNGHSHSRKGAAFDPTKPFPRTLIDRDTQVEQAALTVIKVQDYLYRVDDKLSAPLEPKHLLPRRGFLRKAAKGVVVAASIGSPLALGADVFSELSLEKGARQRALSAVGSDPLTEADLRTALGNQFLGAPEWRRLGVRADDVPPLPTALTRDFLQTNVDSGSRTFVGLLPKGVSLAKLINVAKATHSGFRTELKPDILGKLPPQDWKMDAGATEHRWVVFTLEPRTPAGKKDPAAQVNQNNPPTMLERKSWFEELHSPTYRPADLPETVLAAIISARSGEPLPPIWSTDKLPGNVDREIFVSPPTVPYRSAVLRWVRGDQPEGTSYGPDGKVLIGPQRIFAGQPPAELSRVKWGQLAVLSAS